MRNGWFALIALVATACTGPRVDHEQQAGDQPAQEAPAADPAPPSDAGDTPSLSRDGLGPLRFGVAPTEPLLEQAFPGATVVRSSFEAEGDTYERFEVKRGDHLLATVEPTTNGADIIVRSPQVRAEGDVRVGRKYEALAGRSLQCFVSAEATHIICDDGGLQYLFSTEGLDAAPEETVPASSLAGRGIEGIRWYPR